MTTDELLSKQSIFTVFLNKPITKEQVDELITGIPTDRVEYAGKRTGNDSEVGWHTLSVLKLKHFNQLRTTLLIDDYQTKLVVTEGKRVYLDVNAS